MLQRLGDLPFIPTERFRLQVRAAGVAALHPAGGLQALVSQCLGHAEAAQVPVLFLRGLATWLETSKPEQGVGSCWPPLPGPLAWCSPCSYDRPWQGGWSACWCWTVVAGAEAGIGAAAWLACIIGCRGVGSYSLCPACLMAARQQGSLVGSGRLSSAVGTGAVACQGASHDMHRWAALMLHFVWPPPRATPARCPTSGPLPPC